MIQEKTIGFLAQLRANPKDFNDHLELSVCHVPYVVCLINSQVAFRENFSCHSPMATT